MVDNDVNFDKQSPYTVPVEGSLGLLALGDKGLKAWREVRKKAQANTENKQNPE